MPYKHNESRRHKFTKATYVWLSEEAIDHWQEPQKDYSGRGRPKSYSDIAVQVSLFFRQLYHLPLRQTQGFMRSLIRLLGLPIDMMDFSNLSNTIHWISV